MAYLANPIYDFVSVRVKRKAEKTRFRKHADTLSKISGSTAAVLAFLLLVIGLFAMIIPELQESVIKISDTLPN